ncbi:hypothetical protein E4Q23_20200 [Candidatus Accumulibacter phosphatis]|uniref:Uncharacterized protein n=1 Tax=Candidatus Accumulibacter phosphatis TaxID=327160 RepID=A0ABX1U4B4_9PROT|nr:hypothetical protein [Candidatus Accumulibacter phosphatis]NMQ29875.1 hypothetical protein [Candidatus Accumulibacter phosphatis]
MTNHVRLLLSPPESEAVSGADDFAGPALRAVHHPVCAAMVDDLVHYRWSSYRTNGLGQSGSLLTPHAVYSSLGANEADRLVNYRSSFRPELDTEAISDIRMALG